MAHDMTIGRRWAGVNGGAGMKTTVARSQPRFVLTAAFGALWTSSTASNLADGVFKLALPLYVATMTTSPAQVATAMAAFSAPWLLLSIPVGQMVDAMDRRRLMVVANVVRVLVLVSLLGLQLLGSLPIAVLYLLAFALGAAEVVADTAASAVLPAVVEREQLEAANSRIVGAHTVGNEFVGPALGGLLFTLGLTAPVAASAALYLVAAGSLLFLKGSFRAAGRLVRDRPGEDGFLHARGSRRTELLEGMAFLLRHRLLLTLTVLVTVMNVCWSAWLTLMPLYAVAPGPVGLSPEHYGLLLACLGVGGVLGTLLTVPLQRRIGSRWVIGIDIVGTAVLLAAPALWPAPWPIAAAAVIGGAGGTMWSILVSAFRQRIVPDALLGRVGAALRLFAYGSFPLGALLAGALAEVYGLRAVLLSGAVVAAALLIPFWTLVSEEALAEGDARA